MWIQGGVMRSHLRRVGRVARGSAALVVLLLAGTLAGRAGAFELYGFLTSSLNGTEVAGVAVTFAPHVAGPFVSDASGFYTAEVPANNYTVTFSKNGYTTQSQPADLSAGAVSLDVVLVPRDPAVLDTLVSVPVVTPPVLDGDGDDAAWTDATVLDILVSGGWYGTGHMFLQSVYANGQIYFKVVYSDPDRSSRREPWLKLGTGDWEHVPSRSAAQTLLNGTPEGWSQKDPDGAYEDKFSLLWNTTGASKVASFDEGDGCYALCHTGQGNGGSGDFGRKYTNSATEIADFWHFKSVRLSPVVSQTDDGAGGVYDIGQVDDQYVDNCQGTQGNPGGDPACDGDWGRHGDPRTGGGYSDNVDVSGTLPAFTSPTQPADGSASFPYFIRKSEETSFVDTFATGDEVAGIRTAAMVGDRGNISSGAHYDAVNQTWTVELTRALETGSTKDVQFSDLGATYFFGAAIFDNAQVEHSTSDLYKMSFVFVPEPSALLAQLTALMGMGILRRRARSSLAATVRDRSDGHDRPALPPCGLP
jgi:hypothetical protein